MATITNTHQRRLPVSAAAVGALLDQLASPDDPLWPSPTWLPIRFDRPLAVGADGGHGPIRYAVTRYETGHLVEGSFGPGIGLVGTHTFEVRELTPSSCVLEHRLVARPVGTMRLLWPTVVRACHDTLIEHLLDNAERAVGCAVPTPVAYPWIAWLSAAAESTPVRATTVPSTATLLRGSLTSLDLEDAYAVRVPPGTADDPQTWADAVFRDPPRAVSALLHLRNRLVGLLGIAPGDDSDFDTVARSTAEVLLGVDEEHLAFRASILVEPDDDGTTVTLSTRAAIRSGRGRFYLAGVRIVHPFVTRAMLRRAALNAVAPPRTVTPCRRPAPRTVGTMG